MLTEVANVDDYAELISRAIAPMHVLNAGASFSGAVNVVQLNSDLQLNHLTIQAASGHRTARLVRQSTDDKVSFVIYYDAGGSLEQESQQVTMRTGEAVLVDTDKPYLIDYPRGIESVTLRVNRHALSAETGGKLPLGVAFSGQTPLMRMLSQVARNVVNDADAGTHQERESLARVAIDLAGAVIRSTVTGGDVIPTGSKALLGLVQADIQARLNDPALSLPELATRHHISIRYLHRLFELIDDTPAAYIREQRLLRSYQILGDPRKAHLSVNQVGASVGILEPSTFFRAFRRRFDMKPVERRAASQLLSPDRSPRSGVMGA